ncbi:MAG: hypothetical protein ACXAC5_03185 [Promethearchaeota archaeon]|jgi:hypothetical protein
MELTSSNCISVGPKHWIYVFAKLTEKDKKVLKKYYSTLYPRGYVRKLIAFLDDRYVQFKESQKHR